MNKKYSQRYQDLVEFMYENRNKIPPIPDYKVNYEDQYQNTLNYIKNSYKRFRKKSESIPNPKYVKSLNHSPTKSIVSINSSRYRDYSEICENENK